MPTRDPQPGDRARSLKLAAYAATKAATAVRERDAVIWFAHQSGSSPHEISEVTGVEEAAVRRIAERSKD